jgi:hypothetical protein
MSVSFSKGNDSDVVFRLGGDDYNDLLTKYAKGDKPRLIIVVAMVFERHSVVAFHDLLCVHQVEPMFLKIGRSLGWIE